MDRQSYYNSSRGGCEHLNQILRQFYYDLLTSSLYVAFLLKDELVFEPLLYKMLNVLDKHFSGFTTEVKQELDNMLVGSCSGQSGRLMMTYLKQLSQENHGK